MQNHTYTDQMGRKITLPYFPKRIVSLVPSQTELLYDLGLNEEVVGQTKFCIHPEAMHKVKKRVGGTKQLKHDIIASLHPDFIIGNKEENEKNDIELLMKQYPVWMSDIKNLADALEMIKAIGSIVNKEENAQQIVSEIESAFSMLKKSNMPKNVLYFIWKNPWMVAGHDTIVQYFLDAIGLNNLASKDGSRYPELSQNEIQTLQPDVIFLSSEPYPFAEKHIPEIQALFPHSKIILVDGEMFTWYGSRLRYTPKYLNKLLEQIAMK